MTELRRNQRKVSEVFSNFYQKNQMSEKRVILVTGGTGLVGKGIELALKEIGQDPNDNFVFLSSKDGDITYCCYVILLSLVIWKM